MNETSEENNVDSGFEKPKEKKNSKVSIKTKLIKLLKWISFTIFIISITFIFLIRSYHFQTWAAKKISEWLSEELKTTICIQKVNIDFLNRIQLNGVFIQDLKKDTLLFGKSITVKISDFSFAKNYLYIDLTHLEGLTSKIIKYKNNHQFNFQFLLDYFVTKDSSEKVKGNFKIGYGNIILNNINFYLIDQNDTTEASGIKFNDLSVTDLSGEINLLKIVNDKIEAKIKDLTFKEKSGFNLSELDGSILISSKEISIEEIKIITEKSKILGNIKMKQQSYDDFSDFLNKVKLELELKDSTIIDLNDIGLFVPAMKEMKEEIKISGNINGHINNLSGNIKNFNIAEYTKFRGDFKLINVSSADSLMIDLNSSEFSTNSKDLVKIKIPGMNQKERNDAFSQFASLGLLKYRGRIKGMLNQLNISGNLKTDVGLMDLNATTTNLLQTEKICYKGKVEFTQINLGLLAKNKDLGKVSGNFEFDGKGKEIKSLDLSLIGSIKSVVYKNYEYKNLNIKGDFKKSKFQGKFELKDNYADVSFEGSAEIKDKNIDLDFITIINKIDFHKTNLITNLDSSNSLSTSLRLKLKGNSLDNFTGVIRFDNTTYNLNRETYQLKDFELILKQNEEIKKIHLSSGVADADIEGIFKITELQNSFRRYLEKYFPTVIKEKKIPKGKVFKDHFNYVINVKNFSLISGLLIPDLQLSNGTIIHGSFDANTSEINLTGNSDVIKYKNFKIDNWNLEIKSLEKSIEIFSRFKRAWITDSLRISNFEFGSSSFDNLNQFSITWNNNNKKKNSGDLKGKITFFNSNLELRMKKIDVWVEDSLWLLTDTANFVKVDTSGKISIHNLFLKDNSQIIGLDGALSKSQSDEMMLTIEKFQLSQINPIIQASLLKLKGYLSGKAKISNVGGKMIFSNNLDFDNFFINDKLIGKGELKSIYDLSKDIISITGFFTKGNILNGKLFNNMEFEGYYYPSKKEDNLDITAKMNALDITFIQPYLNGILTFAPSRGGAIEGSCSIKGSLNKPLITGRLNLMNVKNLKVDYLNTYYNANGVINFFPDRILLGDENPPSGSNPDPIHLFDREGHEATIWGNIFHDNFKIIKVDFDINTNNLMVLNTTGKQNSSYFGKAYVSGSVGIYGNLDFINMDINLKTEKNTEFNIPLSGPADAEESDYIVFTNKDTTKKEKYEYKKSLSGINLNLNLETTPNATVRMIFDSKSGDIISGRGNGNINMQINTNGKFEMYGLYTLTNGDYMFSLENVISKKFEIVYGSTIKWGGDPLNADINITASYNQNSSLAPFFPSDSTGLYSKPVKANVLLNMKDKLLTPDISFGISLPTIDETTRQTVLSYVNNEQEMNRQVFSLLLLKSFVTPLQLANQGVGLGAGSAATRTSSEMLSNQLSNWLTQFNTGVDISVNITPEQMDVALSKQLFNDRLSIDGNVGVNNSEGQKTSNMIGDIQVDYKVYPDGKLRLKGYNKSNDNTQISTLGGPFTQGMGIYYKEEFNTIDELYDKYLGWIRRKKNN